MLGRIICALALFAGAAAAQTGPLPYGARYTATSGALSFFTNRGPRFALLRDRRVMTVAFRREHVFALGDRAAFASFVELPLSLVFPIKGTAQQECFWRQSADFTFGWDCYDVARPRNLTVAVGATPLGVRIY